MDRIINVKVGGNYISKDNKHAGVVGEANVTNLRILFDEGWNGYAKKVTFWDALGTDKAIRTLTTDLLEDATLSTRVYIVPIPPEAMTKAGKIKFVIDGYIEGKRQRSISEELFVFDAPIDEDAEQSDPTPTQTEQLQLQIDAIIGTIQDAVEAKEDIENMSVSSQTLSTGEDAFVNKTEKDGVVNLHFGLPAGSKGDTGNSGVYIGDEEPAEQCVNVWIETNGNDYDFGGIYIGEKEPTNSFISAWINTGGTENVLKFKNGYGKWDNIPTIKGEKGDKGDKGEKGDDYSLTSVDINEISKTIYQQYLTVDINALKSLFCGDVVWTNPDTSVSFEAQTIDLDLSEYNRFEIEWNERTGNGGRYVTTCISKDLNYMAQVPKYLGTGRSYTISDNNIMFGRGYMSQGSEANGECIPVKVIGYKY